MPTQTTDLYSVRFNGLVFGEFEAILGSAHDVDSAQEPALHEVLVALENDPKVVINRKHNKTYEVSLTVDGVEAFAKEVAYYLSHAKDCRYECDSYDDSYAELTKVINGCKTALESANRVLTSLGKTAVRSYF